MRPERASGAPGYPQAQENGTEHLRPGRAYTRARADNHARTNACAGSGRHACEPNALNARA